MKVWERDIWRNDERPIISARLIGDEGEFTAAIGCVFERFERAGEMASIPYLRVTWRGLTTEAPLRNWAWVQFGCPGHVASDADPKVCGHCGTHVEEERA